MKTGSRLPCFVPPPASTLSKNGLQLPPRSLVRCSVPFACRHLLCRLRPRLASLQVPVHAPSVFGLGLACATLHPVRLPSALGVLSVRTRLGVVFVALCEGSRNDLPLPRPTLPQRTVYVFPYSALCVNSFFYIFLFLCAPMVYDAASVPACVLWRLSPGCLAPTAPCRALPGPTAPYRPLPGPAAPPLFFAPSCPLVAPCGPCPPLP